MEKLIEELKNWGADTDAGIQRVMNDEEFYRMLVLKFADSPEFETLEAALDRGDRKAAFGIAHSLKGASANLSLTPFYRAVAEVVEDLRKYSGVGSSASCAGRTGSAVQGAAQGPAVHGAVQGPAGCADRTGEMPEESGDGASEAAEEDAELELHLQQYRMQRDLLMSLARKYAG